MKEIKMNIKTISFMVGLVILAQTQNVFASHKWDYRIPRKNTSPVEIIPASKDAIYQDLGDLDAARAIAEKESKENKKNEKKPMIIAKATHPDRFDTDAADQAYRDLNNYNLAQELSTNNKNPNNTK